MQTCYVYSGELLCTSCGNAEKEIIRAAYPERVDSEFSDHWPQEETISESDTPDHCAGCGCFLQNPLTPDGDSYVRELAKAYDAPDSSWEEIAARAESAGNHTVAEWCRYYFAPGQ